MFINYYGNNFKMFNWLKIETYNVCFQFIKICSDHFTNASNVVDLCTCVAFWYACGRGRGRGRCFFALAVVFFVVVVYYSLVFRIYTVNANVYVCCVSKLAVKIEGTKCKNLQKLLINEKVVFLLLFFNLHLFLHFVTGV